MDIHRRILDSSNCQEQRAPNGDYTNFGVQRSDFECDRKKAMMSGRCAGVISMPGTMTRLLKPWNRGGSYAPQPRVDSTSGNITWQVQTSTGEYWGRRIRFPGSTRVYDHATRALVACTTSSCPKALRHSVTGELVNYAPYFAEGGEAYSIRRGIAPRKTDAMFDLMAWFATLPVTVLPLTGIYRTSQLTEPSRATFLEDDWPPVMVDDLFAVLRFYFRDDESGGGNAVKDLLIPGFSEYMNAVSEELYDNFLLNLTVSFGGLTRGQFDDSYEACLERLLNRYDAVNRKYGKLQQLERWRSAMNMPSLTSAQLCAWPERSELAPADAAVCATLSVQPCTVTGCGKWAQCNVDEADAAGGGGTGAAINLCTCQEGTEPTADFASSRACKLSIASTGQQRIFWTLSQFFFGLGFVLCLVLMNEFWRNPMFSSSGSMWAFAAIALPNFVL